MLRRTSLAVLIVGCGISVAAQGKPAPLDKKNPGYVNSKSLTTPWPFTVSEVIMRCELVAGATPRATIVTVRTAAGQEYALNDTAKTKGFKPFDPIWAANPKVPGTKINPGQLVAFGVRLCD